MLLGDNYVILPPMKSLAFILLLSVLASCGEKSKVDPLFPGTPLSQTIGYGDGELAVFTIKMPLSDKSIDTYDSPIDPNTGLSRVPLLGDALRFITQALFNLGAEFGLGKSNITINQPIPDLNSPYLKSISVKRVFFHIDNTIEEDARPRNILSRVFNAIRGVIRGETRLDFSFIRELNVLLKMERTDVAPVDFIPEIFTENADNLPPRPRHDSIEIGAVGGPRMIELLNYKRKNRSDILRNNERGAMFVVYTERPVQVRAFLRKDKDMAALIKEMVIVNKTLVVELTGQAAVSEAFFELMRHYEDEMAESGITKIDTCNEDICMDVKVNEQNMMPLLLQGNKLRIETNVDSSRVPPKSFQLKGFIEFEVKLDVPI
jgi:hypothetical protein